MVRIAAVLAALATVSPSASAAVTAPSFEQSLNAIRAQFLGARAAQNKAKSVQDIVDTDARINEMATQAVGLRKRAVDLRRRAQLRLTPPFNIDLLHLVLDLQGWNQDMQRLDRRAVELSLIAKKDPAAESAAETLYFDAASLRGKAGQLGLDGAYLATDLRPLGFLTESTDIYRLTIAGNDHATAIVDSTAEIWRMVRLGH